MSKLRTPITIPAILQQRASTTPQRIAFTFLPDGDLFEENLTYAALHQHALAVAALVATTSERGDRVLLLYPQGLSFVGAFFGCLYAGAVAVPVAVPGKLRGPDKVSHIVADAGIQTALTTTQTLAALRRQYPPDSWVGRLNWLLTDSLAETPPSTLVLPNPEHLAFLQYTSGSTGNPKGVMVLHRNIIANLTFIRNTFQYTEQSTSVCWAPAFHDLGLIDGILCPVFAGCRAVLLNPFHVVQKPIRWLRALCRYEHSHGGGPNFMYDLCVSRTTETERAELAFSNLKLLYSAAEPVRAATIQAFNKTFSPYGFQLNTFLPVYGLAESTLAAGLYPPGHGPRSLPLPTTPTHGQNQSAETDRRVVACGKPDPTAILRIVDPDTQQCCTARQIGEIWLAGPSIAVGYWNRPALTRSTFEAYTTTGEGPFLRTGDLGFLTEDGDCCLTGRIKDLIIIRGTNHYPTDLELTTQQSHDALQPNAGAVFSVETSPGEAVVILHEVRRVAREPICYEAITEAILSAISQQHGISPAAIVLLRPGGVLKTTSGKIQRTAC